MAKKKGAGTIVIKVALWYMFILGAFAGYTNWLPQIRGDAPEAAEIIDVSSITPDQLMVMGEKIIFGSNDPLGVLAKGEGPIGKGQCPLCHRFFMEQKADRCPNLLALKKPDTPDPLLKMSEEARSHERPLEPRYAEFKELHKNGEKNSGIIPHAKPGGEYLIESEYCPNCFVVMGYGLKGTNDTVSPMPIINKPPIELADTEIVAVVSFLQLRDGDESKWTAVESWEGYWGKELKAEETDGEEEEEDKPKGPPVALGSMTAEEIVKEMTCYACHKIPGISIAKTGMIGPLLIEKTNAPNRIKSAEYKKAVKAGKAHATTPREYVIESIMDPGAFIVPGFADDMLKDFRHKFTVSGLDVMVDHLLNQDIAKAIADELDRLPNEKEGSILPPPEASLGDGKSGDLS
ncbi:MAG: nitric oxide reductase [Nitrospira sp.]|nr:nitric oxide reductase [Candidatus Manganitrophaceae bacterium]HIL35278.1 nitric oxide reductase [Candidatus Manganitrophaceae bacterium]